MRQVFFLSDSNITQIMKHALSSNGHRSFFSMLHAEVDMIRALELVTKMTEAGSATQGPQYWRAAVRNRQDYYAINKKSPFTMMDH